MGLFDNLFGSSGDIAPAINPYLDKIMEEARKSYNPYIERGTNAYGSMAPQYNRMTNDPTGMINEIMGGYKESEGYKRKFGEMMDTATNAAAAGGYRGSPNDIQDSAKIQSTLMSDDMQQWLQNVLGVKGAGLKGQEHLYDTGYDASKSLSGDISSALGSKASFGARDIMNQDQRRSDLINSLLQASAGGMGLFAASKLFKGK